MVEAILNGRIIEEYPDDQRILVCGHTSLMNKLEICLHVVCEYADSVFIEFVTSYIPNERQWEHPSFRQRKRTRR